MHLIAVEWQPQAIAELIERYEAALPRGAWPNWVLGNHDRSRVASRVGTAQARVAAMLLLTLRGTPTIYYGDELGMTDVPIAPERVRDPYQRLSPGAAVGRDPARSPMPWEDGIHAGFCPPGAEPWLPLGAESDAVNVAAQRADPGSVLMLYRRLLELRRRSGALTAGRYRLVRADSGVLAYARADGGETVLVALNLTAAPRAVRWSGEAGVLLSTELDRAGERVGRELQLRPNEGILLKELATTRT
jgi:alpha-glucosidase